MHPAARRLFRRVRGIRLHHAARRPQSGLPGCSRIRRSRRRQDRRQRRASRPPSTRPQTTRAKESSSFRPGRYRLTRTIYVWPGVRVIGYGATRPVFVLAANTPGFQKGVGVMVMFTGARVLAAPADEASACRFRRRKRAAQCRDCRRRSRHLLLGDEQHRFRDRRGQPGGRRDPLPRARSTTISATWISTSAPAWPALHQVGNEAEDLRFFGGRYGILTEKTSPAWQFTLIDSRLRGPARGRDPRARGRADADPRHLPRRAGGDRHRPAILRPAVGQGQPLREYLQAAVVISNEKSPLTEIGFENAVLQERAGVRAASARAGRRLPARSRSTGSANFNYGLILPGEGEMGAIGTRYDAAPLSALPAPLPPAIRPLPPTANWVNVHTLGVEGRRQDRRHRRHPEGHRSAPRALFPQRPLHRAATRSR